MGLIRKQLERLSRGKTLWRRLPAPFSQARILVTPDAALSYLKPGAQWCDPELIRIVDLFLKPGDVVWDIGANVAIFGAACAVRCGTQGMVLCIEPDTLLSGLIRRTAQKLPPECAKIDVLCAAVAEEPGVGEFLIAERGRASNALAKYNGRKNMGSVRERHLVPIVTLDHLLTCTRPPTFLKIDVEGAEVGIFKGAARLLATARPTIYVEVGQAHSQIVADQLRDAGYVLFDPTQPIDGQSPLEQCSWNTLAMPSERANQRIDGAAARSGAQTA